MHTPTFPHLSFSSCLFIFKSSSISIPSCSFSSSPSLYPCLPPLPNLTAFHLFLSFLLFFSPLCWDQISLTVWARSLVLSKAGQGWVAWIPFSVKLSSFLSSSCSSFPAGFTLSAPTVGVEIAAIGLLGHFTEQGTVPTSVLWYTTEAFPQQGDRVLRGDRVHSCMLIKRDWQLCLLFWSYYTAK